MAQEETRTEEAETAEAAAERRPARRTAAQMVTVGVIASVLGIIAGLLIHWFPPASSTQADKIDTLWDVLIVASVPFFVLVTTVIGFSILNFRMRPGEEHLDGPPIHGNTRLEVIWTAIPATLIVGLVVYAYVVLRDIEKTPALAAGEKERVVRVFGEQFAWTYEYNEGGRKFRTTELALPAGKSVKFQIQSKDVIHDFWVPDFRMKIDAVPGITTSYRVTPKADSIGVHEVVCAELCGLGHAFMRSTVRVMTRQGFAAWVRRTSAAANGGGQAGGGGQGGGGQTASTDAKALFTNGKNATGATACGACHTLSEAGTNGTTGPDLDQVLKGRDAAFIKQSIVQPDAQIAKGYGKGIMPPNYDSTLSPSEVNALVKFLSDATK
jgi:cytochrome c oxidase subunit II